MKSMVSVTSLADVVGTSKRRAWRGVAILPLLLALGVALVTGCSEGPKSLPEQASPEESPTPLPESILVDRLPQQADIVFSSIRYVLNDPACLNEDYRLKANFITDAACNRKIYDPEGGLAVPCRLFTMDLETSEVGQLTSTDYFYTSGQAVNATTLVVSAACSDTDGNGKVNDSDEKQLYLLDISGGTMDCLTCGLGLEAINNPDYSAATGRILFSGRMGAFGNASHLYTIGPAGDLVQVTNEEGLWDFDCAWSEDGTMIVFSRMPTPAFTAPSQIWIADSDGANARKLTDGGPNPDREEPHGVFPIGLDADPDLSPDNSRVVFSRLRTGRENEPFGVFELVVMDIVTGQMTVLDSTSANMVPEWKERGILFTRQSQGEQPMDYRQGLWLYADGRFDELEDFPWNVFPIGAQGGHWIEVHS